jgi:hypothetical protein
VALYWVRKKTRNSSQGTSTLFRKTNRHTWTPSSRTGSTSTANSLRPSLLPTADSMTTGANEPLRSQAKASTKVFLIITITRWFLAKYRKLLSLQKAASTRRPTPFPSSTATSTEAAWLQCTRSVSPMLTRYQSKSNSPPWTHTQASTTRRTDKWTGNYITWITMSAESHSPPRIFQWKIIRAVRPIWRP